MSVLAGHLGEQLDPRLRPKRQRLDWRFRSLSSPSRSVPAGCLAALEAGNDDTLIVYGDMLFDIAPGPAYSNFIAASGRCYHRGASE